MAQPITIVVADDDLSLTRLLKLNLESNRVHVIEARSGMDCIKVVQGSDVDLVLLDLRLPDFNGWGVLGLLRFTDSLKHIPVIVASSDPPNRKFIEFLKPDYYVQKPFDIREFISRVRLVLELGAGHAPGVA
ncbi:MAG: response regulator [Chloroflexi bacterium]|nr:response regulator [Chloroflexota bacterium]